MGVTTDSLDITGEVLSKSEVNVSDEQLSKALEHFTGTYDQVPPMFSAIKKDGVRLYDLARKGQEVERSARSVTIKEMKLLWRKDDEFSIDVLCSKGTYIRSLADDLGKFLGCGACLLELRRTKTAQFGIDECVTLEELEKEPEKYLLPSDRVVDYLKNVNYTESQAKRFKNGAEISVERIKFPVDVADDGELFKVYSNDEFLGLSLYSDKTKTLRTKCVIDG